MRTAPNLAFLACFAAMTACGGKDTSSDTGSTATGTPTTSTAFDGYDFESRFEPGTTSVSHTGQTARQVLITDMKSWLGGITGRIDSGAFFPVAGDVTAELDFYFSFDGASSGTVPMLLETDPMPLQSTYGDISTSANLVGKLAGNDETGQHQDWSTAFVGWTAPGVDTPESLVRHWFSEIDAAAVDRSNGIIPDGPDGQPVAAVYLSADGVDRQQLLEKFLHGAISFSQASDDYLDDDLADKGLNADHTGPDDDAPYTSLEHAWDEGFAYFGAAHVYDAMTDADIQDIGYVDADGDGAIDLGREYCFGASTNAAKRDAGAVVPTDFTQDAWSGFYNGRKLLADTDGALTPEQMTELQGYRDQAIEAWEKAIAATIVHYINEVLVDMDSFGGSYDFAGHAKHWSEMKGFALALQFNPRSPVSDGDFAQLHTLLGQAPVLPDAAQPDIDGYRADLLSARQLLGDAYGFDAANLGDDDGTGGW